MSKQRKHWSCFCTNCQWIAASTYSDLDQPLTLFSKKVKSMMITHSCWQRCGTEIFRPFEEIFAEPRKPKHLRRIFVLTNGEVINAANVIDLVKRKSEHVRLFAIGLGESASRDLVKGIARVAGR